MTIPLWSELEKNWQDMLIGLASTFGDGGKVNDDDDAMAIATEMYMASRLAILRQMRCG